MDAGKLVSAIAEAMFAADANGRIERLGRLADSVSLAAEPGAYVFTPVPYDEAVRRFSAKASIPTGMNSADLALAWPERLRNQAFFSAGVSSANILQGLREEIEDILQGRRTIAEARSRLRDFLAKEGYGIPEPAGKEDRDVSKLASFARLELVLRQNTAMAQASAQRAVSEDPTIVDRWPNYRYIANTDRHARFDGLVLPKTDPFWRSHFPPWDFNCNCMAIDEDGPVNGKTAGLDDRGEPSKLDVKGRYENVDQPESGFVFLSRPEQAFVEFDLSSIEDVTIREILARRMAEMEAEKEA
jgi:hypothetical protein